MNIVYVNVNKMEIGIIDSRTFTACILMEVVEYVCLSFRNLMCFTSDKSGSGLKKWKGWKQLEDNVYKGS